MVNVNFHMWLCGLCQSYGHPAVGGSAAACLSQAQRPLQKGIHLTVWGSWWPLNEEFQGMPVGFYTFQYISHSHKQIRLTNPPLSLFFMSARNALLKSSGRTRRQRAGGLRRVSRSGCWRGWPWWPGWWSAHSLPRNACEGRSTTCLLYPPQPTHHRSWNEGPVCLVGTADDVYSFVPHPLHIPQWTKIPHMLWNSWEEDGEEEESLVFVHHLEKSVVIQGHVFLSFTELIVPSIPFSSLFFPHVCMC